ncbi:zinc transporter ZIP13-like [Gigantopelta aegis]|uniref:zinc transporter ZIP13-like n=1 Tax=Gigantopelta aegis TaxID=1735272 RepID=UPI001B88BE21|nr:zinc transporter ZIP13-like [Gigantopelta aegis]
MGCYQHLLCVLVVICGLWITNCDAEIHRAKAATHRTGVSGVKNRRTSFYSDMEPDSNSQSMQPQLEDDPDLVFGVWTYSLMGAVLVGFSGIFPLLVIPLEAGPALKHGAAAANLKLMLSFAVGGLLGDVFLHLLPEAWAYVDQDNFHLDHVRIGCWVITGMMMFLILEKTFGDENDFETLEDTCNEKAVTDSHINTYSVQKNGYIPKTTNVQTRHINNKHKHKHKNKSKSVANGKNLKKNCISNGQHFSVVQNQNSCDKKPGGKIKISGYLNLLANCIDNFTHGLAVAGSFLISPKAGFLTTFAILLHEIPHEVGDFAILLRSGFDRWQAAKAQLLTASGGVLGVLTALTADSAQAAGERTAWILPFTSGGFLYIALVTVVPDLLQEKHGWESVKQILCLSSGVAAMACVTLIC